MRTMFGLGAFDWGAVVFAMLPELPSGVPGKEDGKWKLFQMEGDNCRTRSPFAIVRLASANVSGQMARQIFLQKPVV
jgi:hypothetical protein